MKLRTLGTLMIATALTACQPADKKSSDTAAAPPAAPATGVDAGAPVDTGTADKPSSPEEASFRRAFAGYGPRREFARAEIVLRQSSLITDDTLENWAGSCAGSLTLVAEFPLARFGLGAITCEGAELPPALLRLLAIAKNLEYKARHLPALPDEPDQFALDLDGTKIAPRARWEDVKSLNSVARAGTVSFDFVGSEVRPHDFDAGTHAWLSATLRKVEGGETLEVEFVFDDFDRREKTSIRFKTKLEAAP